jgi:UDP-N-acetylglucosamine 2-epimerase
MKRLKVVTIVGTRPEIIRLSMLIPKLDEHTDHTFVHTGQNSDPKLNDIFFEDLELRKPDYFLGVNTNSMGSVMGDTLRKAEEVFLKKQPDAVMILGDTNSAVAAIVAERMHIPVYHMEAGNRSFDANVPEELNRKMVDHVATFNLPYNNFSMANLVREGIHPRYILKTGSPIREIVEKFRDKINISHIVPDLGLQSGGYFLASIHRQENVDNKERFLKILSQLSGLSIAYNIPVVLSTHPRTRLKLKTVDIRQFPGIRFEEPFGYLDYSNLQLNAKCVISDSGTIFEEAIIMNFKAICLRDSVERPEALEVGSVLLSPVEVGDLDEKMHITLAAPNTKNVPEGYEVDDFSSRVVNFVLSTAKVSKKWLNINT